MRIEYLVKRIFLFFVIVWAAASLNFFLPRIGGGDPIRSKLLQQAAAGGAAQSGMAQMVEVYQEKFGLNDPLWRQYLTYLSGVFRLDFGYSMANYPTTVSSIMRQAIPWTAGLLFTATILAFIIGTIVGALVAWPRSPKWIRYLLPPLLTLSAVPFFLLGLLLVYVFAFKFKWFPLFGGYTPGTFPDWSFSFAQDVIRHSILPALAILLAQIGFWAIGMRGMMVTAEGEDYMTFGEASGLKGSTLFTHYAMRNALLPQTTGLALSLGQVLSGALLVEVIFNYPGIGGVLYFSIRQFDYFVIQGIIFTVVLGVALATLAIDLIYPLLDPRIKYET